MRIRWPWQRWRKYDLTVNEYSFRVWVNPVQRDVQWLNCPSQYVPSGYSSVAYVADGGSWLDRWKLPIPSEEEMREEISYWLENIDDPDE